MGVSLNSQLTLLWGPQEVPANLNPTGSSMLLLVEQYEIVFIWPFLTNKNMIFLFSQIMACICMACIISQIMVCICERNESCSPGFYENYKALLTPLCYFRFSQFTVPWPISEAPPPPLSPCPRSQHPGPLTPISWTGLLPGAGPPALWDTACLATNLLPGFFFFQVFSRFGRHDRNTVSVPKLLRFWAQCFTSISQVVRAAVIQIEQMTDCTVSRNEQNW